MHQKKSLLVVLSLLLATFALQTSLPSVAEAAAPSFRAANSSNTNVKTPSVRVPSAVRSGDQLVLVVTTNTNTSIQTPSGWTRLGTARDGSDGRTAQMTSSLYTRTATSSTGGQTVSTTLGRRSKTAMTLVAYSNATAPKAAFASTMTGSSAKLATAPTSIGADDSVVVSSWAIRTSSGSTWKTPWSVTERTTSVGSGGGRITAVIGDDEADQGFHAAKTATAGSSSSKAISWVTVLSPTTTSAPAPAPAPTPTPTPDPTPPSSGCTVSSKLVPSCGAWFGTSIPSRDGNYNWSKGLAEYENVAQNVPDILHFYKNGNQSFPTNSEIAVAERPGKQRSLLLYNWKPAGNTTWRQVANGAADNQIATMANGLKKYPHKVFLNIYHEPEDQVKTSSSSGMTVADYKAMYRHVVDELKSLGVNNAVYVWNPMGYYGWRDYLDGLYPGDAYVDWMCYDPYAKDNRQDDLADIVNRVKPNLNWPGYYEWATDKAPGKPLMLCEWGVDTISNSDPASIVSGNAEQLMKDFPMIKAFVYWNSVDKVNARIDNTNTKGKAFGNAFRQLANQSYFNSTSTNKAP